MFLATPQGAEHYVSISWNCLQATGTRIGALVQATSTIVIGIMMSLYFTWKMTLVSLVAVPLIITAVVLEGRVLAAGADTVREAADKANTIASEAISNIRTVNAFCKYCRIVHGNDTDYIVGLQIHTW